MPAAKKTFKLISLTNNKDILQEGANDFLVNATTGKFKLITGGEKCAQDMDVMLLAEVDRQSHFGKIGCGVRNILSSTILSLQEAIPVAESYVRDGITRLHNRQKGARRRAEEVIDDNPMHIDIGAAQDPEDPTGLLLYVRAQNVAGEVVNGARPLSNYTIEDV